MRLAQPSLVGQYHTHMMLGQNLNVLQHELCACQYEGGLHCHLIRYIHPHEPINWMGQRPES